MTQISRIPLSLHIPAEQMSGDDEGNGHNNGGDQQLPRPQVSLKEERYG